MRQLSNREIEQVLRRNPAAKKIAVENFLSTMGDKRDVAMKNLGIDAESYRWSMATVRAIAQGIWLACT